MNPVRDKEVQAAADRDRAAFDRLVAEHGDFLRQFMERRVPSMRVDDLLQEVWLAAWTALPSFDRRSRFQTWLCAICLNKVRDFYRRERRAIPQVALREGALRVDSANVPEAVERREEVRGIVARLSEKHREVIELYYCCEYTLPEIAKGLNRNLNTVKYQFYAAHAELAAMLKEGVRS